MAEYQGKKVTLNKPFYTPGEAKKKAVYVRNPKGTVIKVRFGDLIERKVQLRGDLGDVPKHVTEFGFERGVDAVQVENIDAVDLELLEGLLDLAQVSRIISRATSYGWPSCHCTAIRSA